MICIHGLGSSVIDYVIFDIPVSNQIVTFDLLNDHELDFEHRPLTLTLNFVMQRSVVEENSDNQRKLRFDKSKVYISLKDLNSELHLLTYKDNIENLYQILQLLFPLLLTSSLLRCLVKKILERPTLGMTKNVKLLGKPTWISSIHTNT
jgi:hypothetical protein